MKRRGLLKDVKSVTADNGCEFLDPKAMKAVFGCDVYYTRAYASWEKGSVENCNRIVRRWYPKGTDFGLCSRADIRRLETVINSIHRLSLGGMSAHAVTDGKERRLHQKGVLVVRADEPDVGACSPAEIFVRTVCRIGSSAVLDGHLLSAGGIHRLDGHGCRLGGLVAHRLLTRMMVSPICTSSPSRRVTGWAMRWSLTVVPLVDPRSSRTRAGPCSVKRAWVADT